MLLQQRALNRVETVSSFDHPLRFLQQGVSELRLHRFFHPLGGSVIVVVTTGGKSLPGGRREGEKASQKLSVEECFFHRLNFPKNPFFSSPTVKLRKPDFFPKYGNSKWNFQH